jgi:hypothetical protein
MSIYVNSAFGPPFKTTLRMQTGTLPIYLFGNFCPDTQPFVFSISAISGSGSSGSATVQLVSGGGGTGNGVPNPFPAVGAVMGIQGVSLDGGEFNVDPTTVQAVSLDANGAGTIEFPSSHAVSTTPTTGTLVVRPYEYPDLVSAGSASIPVAQTFTPDDSDNARCLFAEAVWSGTIPTAATVVLQAANVNLDNRFYTVENNYGVSTSGTVAQSDALSTVAGSAVTQNGAEYAFLMGKFLRAKVLSMTGGDDTTALVVTLFA